MKRSPLGVGKKSLERGSTFKPSAVPKKTRRDGFTPASKAQRAKVRERGSIISGEWPCDAAHLTPRAWGGCEHPDCVIPLTRLEHRAFDDGRLDVLGALIAHGCWAELAHAVLEHHVDPIALIQRCTGVRWAPLAEREAA